MALWPSIPLAATAQFIAKVRIEVFSDFQCPGCKILHEGTLQQLKKNYVQNGRVSLTHRNFPLPQHRYSRLAAAYAAAAQRIGKYDPVADALFRTQEQWGASGNIDAALNGVLPAAELDKVRKLARDPAVGAEVQRDFEAGQAIPITQTPTLVLYTGGNRYPVPGAVSYEVLKRAVDNFLAK